jgi:coenzyme F420-reducing hydrogenase beta subunit
MRPPIISRIDNCLLCIGCGLCAAICPQEALEMAWNRHGEYRPIETKPCSTECGLCHEVCPFADHEENEDTIGKKLYGNVPGISHLPETGYYLAAYVGYSEKHRPSSASGGVATWLLERLLAEEVVDHVICVAPTGNPEKLFSFKIFDTPESVRFGAGSAYYPVEMSGVIKQVIEVPGRYAITGLPCFLKAIRLAQQRNAKLRERIVVTVGLVCGQMKSKHFTDYMATVVGVHGNVIGVQYRGKSLDHPATNYHYSFTIEGDEVRTISWKEGISEAWTNRWFTPKACNYCDDVFAECSDVTCMDAWLPEYSKDSRGTSLVLVRSLMVEKVITRGQGARLEPISVNRVVRSQAGVVAVKRQHLRYRLYLDQEKRQKVLKRVRPEKPRNLFLRREIVLKDKMRIISRDLWDGNTTDTKSLREAMRPVLKQLAIQNAILLPVRAVRHLLMTIKATF